jgi:alpha 1,2-mannosyltransferase
MVQYDPREDYQLTQKDLWRVKDPSVAPPPPPFFIHANFPKFNPATILDKHDVVDATHDSKGNFTRPWSIPEETIKQIGEHVERQFWAEIIRVGCELEGKFEGWKNETGICDRLHKFWKVVFENS